LSKKREKMLFLLLGIAALVCIVVVTQAFLRKPATTLKLAVIPAGEYDPAIWGKYYPLQYESYKKNLEMAPSPTGFGGSEKVQKSVQEPEILVNFKGMAFSKDYTEDRGHPYAVQDLKETKRVNPTTPGACMTCKSPNLIDIYKDMGWNYAQKPLTELFPRLKHPNCLRELP
jgi:nitrite reductase (cytochrome c-552)